MRPLLRLRNVEAWYGPFRALSGVSMIVPPGSVVAMLGPNGAGKTTVLRAVSGMLPCRGEISLDGRRIDGLADHAIAALGVAHVPEGRGVFPALTVRENLTMAMHAGHGDIERALAAFPVLAERLGQHAGTLSGGEQQMLALARAVANRPRLLLADELSLGLAPRVVADLFAVLRRIRDDGTTILLVEQYVRHALAIADVVVLLQKGRVRFVGEPGELARDETLIASYLGHAATAGLAE